MSKQIKFDFKIHRCYFCFLLLFAYMQFPPFVNLFSWHFILSLDCRCFMHQTLLSTAIPQTRKITSALTLLTALIQRSTDYFKKQVAQRATIAHLSPTCQGQSAPKPYAAFPTPNDATHKIWSRLVPWLQRYSSSKVWNFRLSRASNSRMSSLIQPKIELDRAFMPVLVTSYFDDDSIKNERARMETPFSHYKSMGNV